MANPHPYRLAFSTPYGSGRLAPQDTIPPAHRAMVSLLEAIAAAGPPPQRGSGRAGALDRQLERWARSRPGGAELGADVLRLGVFGWTRLHGLVSLEIEGAFASMELDPELLFAAEVDQLIAERSAG